MKARRRWAPVVPLIAATAMLVTSCGLFTDEKAEALEAFAEALGTGDAAAAAALTTDPAAAEQALRASLDGMSAESLRASIEVADGAGALVTVWDLADGRVVTTEGEATAVDTPAGARIDWSPAVLDSRLAAGGRLLYSDVLDLDTPIVDRSGEPVMTWQPVTVVSIDREAAETSGTEDVAARVAALVSPVVPSITAGSIADGLADAAGNYVVVTRRDEDIAPVREALAGVDGVGLADQARLLTARRGMASPAYQGLPEAWEQILERDSGWSVTIDNPDETIQVAGEDPAEVPEIATTLDLAVQQAAQDAVESSGLPSMIVALEPGTGEVLAVAQNQSASAEGPVALTGLYAPGSTFKIVTTSAALAAGITEPSEVLPCPGIATIEGRTIPNDEEFDLGEVPLRTAFARSCNTTQAMLAVALAPDALTSTARSLGLGVDLGIPGLTTITGSVPVTEGGPARVEAAIGQGEVLASPFGMALAVASLSNDGQMVVPSLIDGETTTSDSTPTRLEPGVAEAIRDMMRETVRSGTATALADIAGLGGKTGTAEVAGAPANGWFIGLTEDIAFATLVVGADSSAPAVAMSGSFLRAVPTVP
ncbi:penicillin-binding protein [Hoyosella sp. G463]|uniref:Penicillin-binding protein n=2 Tax=Lolliginicoccus lacisalsi TaxID=2742202 RepID=A0A927J9Z1_9ACTN|nr:penicillin-binding protein [Lolliginicoccus lacisalsi]